ncbi:MAG: hypothetical protein RIC55_04070 [Pirellulaceae bacterium]
MTPLTLAKFLIGSREAIEQIARAPQAIFVGLLFVLSAGLAREYDGEDLLHEPWHLLLPLAASLATATLLYLLVAGVGFCRGAGIRPFLLRYRAFLSLYWMTAPLAWLYAIPVERFLSPLDSIRANLWLLGIVALWRVLLITRVVSVLYRTRYLAALLVVMLMADVVAVSVIVATPRPVVGIMGGIRLTEAESLIHATSCLIIIFGVLSIPIWFFGAVFVAIPLGGKRGWLWTISADALPLRVGWGAWTVAASLLVVGVALLPLAQPEQQRRWIVEDQLRHGRIDEALQFMSKLDRDDFPPYWDPPPRIGYGERKPDMWSILKLVQEEKIAPWVREVYIEKLVSRTQYPVFDERDQVVNITELDDDNLRRYVNFIASLPEPQQVASHHSRLVDEALYEYRDEEYVEREDLSAMRRNALKKLESLESDDE